MIPLEEVEQKALVQWIRAKKLFFFAPMSENNAHKQNRHYAMIAEAKAKAMGKIKGVSDIIVFLPTKILFIELKRQKKKLKNGNFSNSHSKPKKEQIEFLGKVNLYPYAKGYVAYGAKEAIEIIEEEMKR